MTVKQIFEFLDSKFPISTACDFDKVGILVGDSNAKVNKALLSLDCTLDTVKKAVDSECQLIITHHPVIFSPLKSVLSGSIVYELIRNNITVISMHTNLDVGPGGVNTCLCDVLGLQNTEIFIAEDGYALQKGEIAECSAESFAELLKNKLNTVVKYVDGGKVIKNVLVCSGSGGNFISDAIKGSFDALVTADVKHNQFLEAYDSAVSLFDCGHYNTEDIVIEPLCDVLSEEFKEVEFITTHKTNIKYK